MSELPRTTEDDEVLDRLVDGELTRTEYQELLRALEQRPDGWRRCALAFLEAQAWSHDLQGARQEVEAAAGGETQATADARRSSVRNRDVIRHAGVRPHFPRWSMLVAIAASFLMAFGLGVVVRWPRPWSLATGQGPPVIKIERNEPASSRAADPREDRPQVPAVAPVPPESRGNVRLVVNRGEGLESEPFELPVHDLSPENAWLLSNQNPTVPAEVQRLFQRAGGQLRWERHVVPLRTLDGRQILLPLEQMEVTPVRGQRYQ